MSEENHLLYFYGTECVPCKTFKPMHEQLEADGFPVLQLEVWHNAENMKKLQEVDQGRCGAVPYHYNVQTDKFICGECDYNELLAWAKGE